MSRTTSRADGRKTVTKQIDGRRFYGYGGTVKAARDDLAKKLARAANDRPTSDARISYRAVSTACLRTAQIRETTRTQYQTLNRVHVLPMLGSTPIGKIRPAHLRDVLDEMAVAGKSVSTRRSTYAMLRKVFAQAYADEQVANNPVLVVARPRPSERPEDQPKPARYLEPAQARTLVQAVAEDRLAALWATGLAIGARRGELLALRWANVDLDAGTITIKRQLQRQTGRGLVEVEPKSKRGVRPVAIPPELVRVLRKHRLAQLEEQLRAGQLWEHDDHVFTTVLGRPLDPSNTSNKFAKLARQHGLDLSTHSMRHTVATLLLSAGRPVNEVAGMLGQSPAVLLSTYAHVLAGSQQQSAAVIGAAIFGDRSDNTSDNTSDRNRSDTPGYAQRRLEPVREPESLAR